VRDINSDADSTGFRLHLLQQSSYIMTTSTSSFTSSSIDILIVGAGPAGLFLAAQLAKINAFHASRARKGDKARRITYRIVDKAEHKVLVGHADGQSPFPATFQGLPDSAFRNRLPM
jgi:NADH dehydrogenase FAD-containing subunit